MDNYLQLVEKENSPISTQKLIQKVLCDPSVYDGFCELSEIFARKVVDCEYKEAVIQTLKIFSYGTYNEYILRKKRGRKDVLNLSKEQINKLRVLTVVKLVSKNLNKEGYFTPASSEMISRTCHRQEGDYMNDLRGVVPYSLLCEELCIDKTDNSSGKNDVYLHEIEDIVIKCIYAGLISRGCRLDQQSSSLLIRPGLSLYCGEDGTVTGNIVMEDIPDMMKSLEELMVTGKRLQTFLEIQYDTKLQNEKDIMTLSEAKKWADVDEIIQQTKKITNNICIPMNRDRNVFSSNSSSFCLGDYDAVIPPQSSLRRHVKRYRSDFLP